MFIPMTFCAFLKSLAKGKWLEFSKLSFQKNYDEYDQLQELLYWKYFAFNNCGSTEINIG